MTWSNRIVCDGRSVKFTRCDITDDDISEICKTVKKYPGHFLHISEKILGYQAAMEVITSLQGTNFNKFCFRDNVIGNSFLELLSEYCENNSPPAYVNLQGNRITTEAISDLVSVVHHGCRLDIDIFTKDFKHFVRLPYISPNKVHFTIVDTVLADECADFINVLLKSFRNVRVMLRKLCFLLLSSPMAERVAASYHKALKGITIQKISLSFSDFLLSRGAENIIAVFKDSVIDCVCLDDEIDQTESGVQNVAKFIKRSTVYRLELTGKRFNDINVKYLAEALKGSSVTQLEISHNGITDIGSGYIADVLSETMIHFINLDGNKITLSGIKYFLGKCCENSQVTHVIMSNNVYSWCRAAVLDEIRADKRVQEIGNFQYFIPNLLGQRICVIFESIMYENPLSKQFDFARFPTKCITTSILNVMRQYTFFVKTLIQTPQVRVHLYNSISPKSKTHYYSMEELTLIEKYNALVKSLPEKFIKFIHENMLNLMQAGLENEHFLDIIDQFEDIEHTEIVKSLLLHRHMCVLDFDEEVLYPGAYKLLSKYGMVTIQEDIEPDKREKVISYFQKRLDIKGAEDIVEFFSAKPRTVE